MLEMTKRFNRRKAEVSGVQDPAPREGGKGEEEEGSAPAHAPQPQGRGWGAAWRLSRLLPAGAAAAGQPGGAAVCGAPGPQGDPPTGDTLRSAPAGPRGASAEAWGGGHAGAPGWLSCLECGGRGWGRAEGSGLNSPEAPWEACGQSLWGFPDLPAQRSRFL